MTIEYYAKQILLLEIKNILSIKLSFVPIIINDILQNTLPRNVDFTRELIL